MGDELADDIAAIETAKSIEAAKRVQNLMLESIKNMKVDADPTAATKRKTDVRTLQRMKSLGSKWLTLKILAMIPVLVTGSVSWQDSGRLLAKTLLS